MIGRGILGLGKGRSTLRILDEDGERKKEEDGRWKRMRGSEKKSFVFMVSFLCIC